ncbi:MAG: 1-deoxy-D-xylulose-5-phosphate synthase [Acholeplasmatales bacterium]|jgi:1-deoxy-D-xylulose-5-phosphate synthase|nr:1-deoxy-D-xylulose-5-phosphate synthase [Acholeplasmataceae bacterium]MCK9289749.1 1-deoxy-D-xylulose-5-phosphate synthase [Acholeplasmataceae bacterium]MCK9428030.1 1-deoxy-D-xylulose-5-phosphate synthase [Acholeplasmataceae bacterium]MDY0115721.1 1-deoxy-D-xylulose-5-phosphate synthase [Acholeplasmatales bacterium]
MSNLKAIKDPNFLKELSLSELTNLAEEIRSFLIENIKKTGGHLASNLGVVELTIALHYVFNSPLDSIIFDVSHQSYTHKILTGRINDFPTLRKAQGLSGYASYHESVHDKWESGHAGTSLSALFGYLKANQLKGKKDEVIAVVGDASITNGTNMEALNLLASEKDLKGIIVINDNKMSISKSVGAFSKVLTNLRGSPFLGKLKAFFKKITPAFIYRFFGRLKRAFKALLQRQNIFEEMGYVYIGPFDGNNLKELIGAFKAAKKLNKSVVIHTITQKGKGYSPAESDLKGVYHGVEPSVIGTSSKENNKISFSEAISVIIEKLTEKEDIFVVMPAMLMGTKFLAYQKKYPRRIIDVGIAEEHAAVMSASLALNGVNVFLPLYSTFSQRAYDQILNDIARPNLKVIIGIDRAGFVGEDGSTHQGLYDVSMFLSMPNVSVTMPKDMKEAAGLLKYAFSKNQPFVIRYPRTNTELITLDEITPLAPSWELLRKGKKGIIISYGPILLEIEKLLIANNFDFSLCNARYIRPLDEKLLKELLKEHQLLIVYEETHASGSLYQFILAFAMENGFKNQIIALNAYNKIINHGTIEDNRKAAALSMADLKRVIEEDEIR